MHVVTDGWLSPDGRHMSLTSKDLEQLETFKNCLNLKAKISWKKSGNGSLHSHVQLSDSRLYRWFNSIGITPQKTFTLHEILVPDAFFFDFLRGEFDGDGSSHAYWDTRWRSSVSLYVRFTCASKSHLTWLNKKLDILLGIKGTINFSSRAYYLTFSKTKASILHDAMYYAPNLPYLKRKKEKLDRQWAAHNLAKLRQVPSTFIKDGSILRIA